jgi:CDP-glucose 4,6-dehydratase
MEGLGTMTGDSGFWEGKRVFVTGATGIVGSWVVRDLLERSAEVVALVLDDNPQSELYRSGFIKRLNVVNGRLEDFTTLERAITSYETDSVIHLGAQPIVDVALRSPLHTFETNIRGTWNLLEACRLHGDVVKRVVIASSDKAYGEQPVLPYTEDMPLKGHHPYDVSKSCADAIGQAYFYSYALPVAVARCGNIYGGGDLNWSRIVPGTIRALYLGQSPLLRSDGNFIRDYEYVKDVSRAYLTLAEKLDSPGVMGGCFNFSPETQVTVFEIVRRICKVMHCEHIQPTVMNAAKAEIRNQYLSASKAHSLLGWRSAYSLDQGLEETVAWYQDFFRSQGLAKPTAKATT